MSANVRNGAVVRELHAANVARQAADGRDPETVLLELELALDAAIAAEREPRPLRAAGRYRFARRHLLREAAEARGELRAHVAADLMPAAACFAEERRELQRRMVAVRAQLGG